jgi:CRP/FNR family transcriptional regulator, cyclic AMP receptor protein
VETSTLAGIGLFSGLSKKDLARLDQWSDELNVPAGTSLTGEGRLAHEFCVIVDGAATVTRDGHRVAELGPGDFFGEIALLETGRRTATVTASTSMRLIVMFEREFRLMRSEMPAVADKIRATLQARLDINATTDPEI